MTTALALEYIPRRMRELGYASEVITLDDAQVRLKTDLPRAIVLSGGPQSVFEDKKDFVLTHHDLNPKNIIFNKNNIKIIDWEYSGVNNKFFDLASICVEFNLNKKKDIGIGFSI